MFSSRKSKSVRNRRRILVERLEGRCLLSVNLGAPSAGTWTYGQTESIAAVVAEPTNVAPPTGTEVDLINAPSATTGSASSASQAILVKGYTDSNGNVSFDLTKLNVGAYNLEAEFTDSLGNLETSTPQAVSVTQAATTTTLATSDPAPVYGEALTITATVAPSVAGYGTPTGWVVFYIDGAATTAGIKEKLNSSGVATLTIPGNPVSPTPIGLPMSNTLPGPWGLQVGKHTITATYLGDADFATSTATPLSLPVAQASTTTTLTSSADGVATVPFGQPIVFKATVQVVSPGGGIPFGFVTFVDTSTTPPTVLGKAYVALTPKTTGPNSGVASFVDSNLPVGTHTINAYYQANRDYLASDTTNQVPPETVTIGATATDTFVFASPNPAIFAAPVTITANVVPEYFGPAPGAAVSVVPFGNPGGITGTPPTFNGPTGTVQFLDNGNDLGSPVPLVYGRAMLTVPSATAISLAPLPVGTDIITAVYIPDAASPFGGSTSKPYSEVILATPPAPTTTTVTPKQQQIAPGSEASFTITVSPNTVPGTDTVTLYDSGNAPPGAVPPVVLLGTATYDSTNLDWTFTTTTPLSLGTHNVVAVFGGDANYASSQGTAVVAVQGPTLVPTVTTVTPKQQQITSGSEASFTIGVSSPSASPVPIPGTDTVAMYDLGSVVVDPPGGTNSGANGGPPTFGIFLGDATYNTANQDWTFTTTTPLSGGYHTIEALFGGDAKYAPSQGFASVTVVPVPVPTTTTVTPKQQQIPFGSEASFTITVTPATTAVNTSTVPGSDTVSMYDLGSPNPAGSATTTKTFLGTAVYDTANQDWTFTTTTPLSVGTHSIEAIFSGDANFATSQGFASVVVLATPVTPVG
jgi:large repetitive protein